MTSRRVAGDETLYGDMMRAINTGHDWGDRMRMVKLPLILTDTLLYAGAISQFYRLTRTLEEMLEKNKDDVLVKRVLGLGLKLTPGYEADLQQLYGKDAWRSRSEVACTAATKAYCEQLQQADSTDLVAASFILYGALVVGGGKSTQRKVKKVFPACDHVLFDVAEDMLKVKKDFKELFAGIGKDFPERKEALCARAAHFMGLNNTVVLSVRCLPFWWWQAVAVTGVIAAVAVAARRRLAAA
eukprot:TRINITY_DN77523_c0_g1_i1.p1 TRINITY_DN77523_c0_g1~~TRINITY_DN77523_c0_g1_i1.p1  ORF type:complete len:242 (-),score=62.41 TRINITY_DN77523_c0_g1_i1:56-781(-)